MGLLRRLLLGEDKLPQNLQDKWPELAKQWAGRQVERPDLAAKVGGISEMGLFSKWMNPDAYGSTSPFGHISLNRDLIEKDKQDLGDVLIHEMTHVGQGQKGFLRKYYEPNKVENEAVNAEGLRKVRKTDIPLRGNKIDPSIKVPEIKVPY